MDINNISKCFICSANCVSIREKVDEEKNKLCQRFCTLLCRYLNIKSTFCNQYKTLRLSNEKNKKEKVEKFQINICDKCQPEVESFCHIYENWFSLKLKLNWSVKKITKLMNVSKDEAGGLPGQAQQTELDRLRRQVLLSGGAKLKSNPELKIKKLQTENGNHYSDSLCFQQRQLHKIKQDDDDDNPRVRHNYKCSSTTNTAPTIIEKWKDTPNSSNSTMLTDFFQNIHSRIGSVSQNKIRKQDLFNCRFCERSFRKKHNLDKHEAIHSGVRVSEDTIDGEGVDGTEKAHKPKQISIPLWNCKECNKNFTRRADLHRHQKHIHSGLKPFDCQVCGRAFPTKYYLTLHETTHTGKRPFSCNICGAQFARKRYCKLHQLSIHKITDGVILTVETPGENFTESTACGSSSNKIILNEGLTESSGENDKRQPRVTVTSSFRSNIKDNEIAGPSRVFLVKAELQNTQGPLESVNTQESYSILPDPIIAENMDEDYNEEEEKFILPDFD